MPSRKEVAGWHRELAKWFKSIANMSEMTCTNELNLKRANLWEDRAAHVEAMFCETCSSYVSNEDEESCPLNQIEFQGKGFGCWSHKPKENPDPNE